MTHLADLLTPQTIRVRFAGGTKSEVIGRLVDLLDGHEAVHDLDAVRASVHDRELRMSTGVGKGLALPHAKTSAVDRTVAAFAIADEPIPFDAIDREPVRLLFLLVDTEGARAQHVKLLSRISLLMNRDAFRERLLLAETPEDVLKAFAEAEAELLES